MRFTATFLNLILFLPGALARPSIRESCGTDAQVIDKRILATPSGNEITFTTRLCPGFAALMNATTTPSTVSKRQTTIIQCGSTCDQVACNTTVTQPSLSDCNELTAALIQLDETFLLPSQSAVEVDDGTCFYAYGNFDTVPYDVCTSSFGLLGQVAVTDCFDHVEPIGTLTAGSCLSPLVPGSAFIVESGFF